MKGIVLVREDGWIYTVIPHGLTVTFTTEGRKAVAEGDGFKFAFGPEIGTDKARALALKVATAYANGETGVFGGKEVEKPAAEPVGPVVGMRVRYDRPKSIMYGHIGSIEAVRVNEFVVAWDDGVCVIYSNGDFGTIVVSA